MSQIRVSDGFYKDNVEVIPAASCFAMPAPPERPTESAPRQRLQVSELRERPQMPVPTERPQVPTPPECHQVPDRASISPKDIPDEEAGVGGGAASFFVCLYSSFLAPDEV